jgi:glycosyltransferase involved in cell wall biosynthesis
LKILYIYNLYQQQGGENLWFESEPDLFRAHGHEVTVYRRDNNELRQRPLWRNAALLWEASWSARSYREVRALIQEHRPDVAHVYNTIVQISPSVYYACRDEGVPVVQSIYNYRLLCPEGTLYRNGKVCEECSQHSLMRAVRYGCYRRSRLQSAAVAIMQAYHRWLGTWTKTVACYLVPSPFVRTKLIEGGIPADKIVIKPNWHEPDPGLRTESDGSFLYAGQLSDKKGTLTMLRAWDLIPDPPLLRIFGDGPLRHEVESAAARNPRIEYAGKQPHHVVISYLQRSTAFLVPSEWYEAFPHTILEAFACAVPVIASRIGTLQDVIADGETGFLFTSGDSANLARVVAEVRSRPDAAKRAGAQGRHEYDTRYRGALIYDALLSVYQSVSSACS